MFKIEAASKMRTRRRSQNSEGKDGEGSDCDEDGSFIQDHRNNVLTLRTLGRFFTD